MRITHEGDINVMFALCLGVGNTEKFLITLKGGAKRKCSSVIRVLTAHQNKNKIIFQRNVCDNKCKSSEMFAIHKKSLLKKKML